MYYADSTGYIIMNHGSSGSYTGMTGENNMAAHIYIKGRVFTKSHFQYITI